jgi:hypothetical protein
MTLVETRRAENCILAHRRTLRRADRDPRNRNSGYRDRRVKLLTAGDLLSCNKIASGQKIPPRAGVDSLDSRLARRLMDARPLNVQTFSGVTIMKACARRLLLGALAAISAVLLTSQLHAQSLRAAPNVTPASEEGITEVLAFLNRDAAGNLRRAPSLLQEVQGTISISPDIVDTGTTATVTFTTSGFFDLSQIQSAQLGIRPDDDISNIQIVRQTAQHLTLTFQIADTAGAGTRTLFITNSQGETVVALDLILKVGSSVCSPHCVSPKFCSNNVCVSPPPPPPPPRVCNPDCDPDSERCVNGRCVSQCTPRCRPGQFCDHGRCTSTPPH